MTTGDYNTAMGLQAGLALTTGTGNTFIGDEAGKTTTTGSNNTVIGRDATASSATVLNTVTLGSGDITALRCQVQTISSLSDERDKTDIVDLPLGLDFLNTIRPVKFTWKNREPIPHKDGTSRAGFIAQELDKAQKDAGVQDYMDLVYDDNPDKLEANAGHLLPVMVQAIKELSAENNALKARLDAAGL